MRAAFFVASTHGRQKYGMPSTGAVSPATRFTATMLLLLRLPFSAAGMARITEISPKSGAMLISAICSIASFEHNAVE